jgi:site-specific DNA-methyltransferase (adenine-specific)
MDCMEGMKEFPDKYFELAIVDPPYGICADKKNSNKKLQSNKSACLSKDYGKQEWDSDVPTEDYFIELKRVSKNQIIWGVNYYPYAFLTGGRIYWDKCVTMPTYSNGELAYCSLINSIKSVSIAWHGMIQENMKDKEIRIHPTQKPVTLYEWLLHNYAKQGDKILDTHVGSASSLIACHNLGFQYVGFELDKEYYEQSLKRLETVKKQVSILDVVEKKENIQIGMEE